MKRYLPKWLSPQKKDGTEDIYSSNGTVQTETNPQKNTGAVASSQVKNGSTSLDYGDVPTVDNPLIGSTTKVPSSHITSNANFIIKRNEIIARNAADAAASAASAAASAADTDDALPYHKNSDDQDYSGYNNDDGIFNSPTGRNINQQTEVTSGKGPILYGSLSYKNKIVIENGQKRNILVNSNKNVSFLNDPDKKQYIQKNWVKNSDGSINITLENTTDSNDTKIITVNKDQTDLSSGGKKRKSKRKSKRKTKRRKTNKRKRR